MIAARTPSDQPGGQPDPLKLPRPAIAAITVLLLMPFALSSWFLLGFAEDLGLPVFLRPVLPLSFDAVAILLVSMTVFAVMRYRERAGLLKPMTWLFVAGSATLNYLHGAETPEQPYDEYIFAALSVLGPMMFEVVLAKSRRWLRKDHNEVGFGARWLIAPGPTFRAWKLGILNGIANSAAAIKRLQVRELLAGLPEDERVIYALGALSGGGELGEAHRIREWLADHGITVTDKALRAAIVRRDQQREQDTRLELAAAARDTIDQARLELAAAARASVDAARADAAQQVEAAQAAARHERAAREQAEAATTREQQARQEQAAAAARQVEAAAAAAEEAKRHAREWEARAAGAACAREALQEQLADLREQLGTLKASTGAGRRSRSATGTARGNGARPGDRTGTPKGGTPAGTATPGTAATDGAGTDRGPGTGTDSGTTGPDTREAARRYLAEHPEATGTELAAVIGTGDSYARRLRRELLAEPATPDTPTTPALNGAATTAA